MKKIALITPMLQPYRISFYEKLDKLNSNIEFRIFHGVKKSEDGRPAYSGTTTFKNVGVEEQKYKIGPFDVRVHKGLYQSVIDFNPDMIIIQSITGNLSYRKVVNWASRNNKVIVNWACAWEPGNAKGLLLKFKNLLVRSFYKKGDYNLTYSTKAIEYIKERGIDESKIEVCYNGIEIDEMVQNEIDILQKSKQIIQQHSLQDAFTFLYVGGLIPEKRVDLLIDAFSKLQTLPYSSKLLIIGDGPLKQELMDKVAKMNLHNIQFLGRIINDVDQYFAASTCFVLPGVGGLALNQAMFWRKICIASEADGTEEDLVINGKTGFRFTKDNLDSLTDSMQKALRLTADELQLMGNNAREIIVNKSSVNHMVNVFHKTIINFFPEMREVH